MREKGPRSQHHEAHNLGGRNVGLEDLAWWDRSPLNSGSRQYNKTFNAFVFVIWQISLGTDFTLQVLG